MGRGQTADVDTHFRVYRSTGVLALPVQHPEYTGQRLRWWSCGKAKVASRGIGSTNDPVETEKQAWEIVFSYARRWKMDMGMTQKAMEYLDQAEENLPSTKFWELLIKTSRASALVKGNELEAGINLAVETTEEIKAFGVLMHLDRIKILNLYLEQLESKINKTRKPLQEALYGERKLDY